MKLCLSLAIFTIVLAIITDNCDAFPTRHRMVYYQQPRSWYAAAAPQHLMYLQYQDVRPSKAHTRSTQAAAALVAGDAVATGTYLKDCNYPENADTTDEEAALETGETGERGAGAQSVAEAYPDQTEFEVSSADNGDAPYSFNQESQTVDEAAAENLIPAGGGQQSVNKNPRDYNFDKNLDSSTKPETADVPVSEDEIPTDIRPQLPVKPVRKQITAATAAPSKRYLPAKKRKPVVVQPEQEEEEEENDDEDDDVEEDDADTALDEYDPLPQDRPARVPNARRPAKGGKSPAPKKPSKGKAPSAAGTFFPIDFGGTTGGAIAIANSYSTGEGGSASSHAVAYGSPEAARARIRPSKYH